jgi:hypothetical protein
MNDELERMCKEEVMTYFKVLSQHLPRNTEDIGSGVISHNKPAMIHLKTQCHKIPNDENT